jgi:hypothetical protein
MSRFKQGKYIPKNPEKYLGDINKITYRSSWELKMNQFLDNNVMIINWGSEIISIPYIKPTDGKMHNYFPDYYIEYIDKDGTFHRKIIEIKPHSQTKKTKARSEKTKLYETIQYAVNMSKWKFCQAFCEKNGLEFEIVTEKELFK